MPSCATTVPPNLTQQKVSHPNVTGFISQGCII